MDLQKVKILPPFKAPNEYFESLDDIILAKLNLPQSQTNAGFEIPDNYFDKLEGQLFSLINIEKVGKETSFSTPKSYFEELDDIILGKIKLEQINKIQVFETHQGFFDQLENQILEKTVQKSNKILPLNTKIWKYVRVAAAILIVSIVGFGLFSRINSNNDQFAQISNQEMIAYLETQNIDESDLEFAISEDNFDIINASINEVELTESELKNYLEQVEI